MAKWEWKTKANKLTLEADTVGIWLVSMLTEVLKELERSECLYDLADAVMTVRLRNTLAMWKAELERLDGKSDLNDVELQDYADLSRDILAIERVIKLYRCEDD